jgi:DNA repair exonuclease SbcCD nuclease subunit
VKILHTADWQIGMRAAHAGERAQEVREARLASAARVVELANERGADVLLLAGDTFEDNAVDPLVVRKIGDILLRARCPVYVLPGNHDPLGPGSVWNHPVWREARARIHVFDSTEPVELGGAVLLPSPCMAKRSTDDPTRAIRSVDGKRLRIGVAHGALRDRGEIDEDDHPIAADAAERSQVDYLALGHWHSTLVLPSPAEARLAYPGTHETTKFGERASGHALLVTLAAPGGPAHAEVLETGTLRWIDRELELHDDDAVNALRGEIDALPDPARALLRLRLSGTLGRAGFDALEALEEAATARFLLARVEREQMTPRPDSAQAWVEALPDGVARSVAERLLVQAGESDAHRREVALAALARLTAMARRAGA